jgi:methylated-DNA-[protein]-cysteine S-methyltransferase
LSIVYYCGYRPLFGTPMLRPDRKKHPHKRRTAITSYRACCFFTPFGWGGIVGGAAGLKKIYLPEPDRSALLGRMGAQFPGMSCGESGFTETVRELQKYFNGEVPFFDCPLDYAPATVFQKKVWQEARAIAYGRVQTYGWLARAVGSPRAVRAVGSALGRNPFPIIIPCHRVIREDGGLGGFSAVRGIDLKESLLRLEGASL